MTKSFLSSEEIKVLIPHRYPFLFLDKIINLQSERSIVAIKNLSINEEFFQGHFPSEPIMPGVLAVEACAQAAGVLCAYSNLLNLNNLCNEEKQFDFSNKSDIPNLETLKKADGGKEQIFYLTSIDSAKFRKPMKPGASLFIHVNTQQKRSIMWKFSAKILIDNEELAMETNFSAFLKQN